MSNRKENVIKVPIRVPKRQQALEVNRIKDLMTAKVITAKAKMASQATNDPNAILEAVRDTILEAIVLLPERQTDIDEIVTDLVEGLVRGIIIPKRSAISALERQIQVLQAKIQEEEQELRSQINPILTAVENLSQTRSDRVRKAFALALRAIEERQEINAFV